MNSISHRGLLGLRTGKALALLNSRCKIFGRFEGQALHEQIELVFAWLSGALAKLVQIILACVSETITLIAETLDQ
jgi:hypothetical protein